MEEQEDVQGRLRVCQAELMPTQPQLKNGLAMAQPNSGCSGLAIKIESTEVSFNQGKYGYIW